MRKALLIPFIIAGLLFLPSCSSKDSNDKESGSIKFCGFTVMEASDLWSKVDRNLDTPDNRARYLTYLYYIGENSDCFSSLVLAQAKTAVGQTILANEITAFYPVHY